MREKDQHEQIGDEESRTESSYIQWFRLYETRSKFYMIGRNNNRTSWRVLKIDRSEAAELNLIEDETTYTEDECQELLERINEGNTATGGLKFVTHCYGIVGFVKFLGPYYMLIITKRRQIGTICGHKVFAIAKSEIIALPHSTVLLNMTYSKHENRYKKLLCTVDLTKDFFFSYSYHVMRSLQKNMCIPETGRVLYETMFVWNEFLTCGIRKHLKSTMWTVALVYGFFKQETISISGKNFRLTLIARRSRHFAGTRYLRRGVNEMGRVANDVETEQIIVQDVPEGCPTEITSVVQNRGSIPLVWSQQTSRLNLQPDIVLPKKDHNYDATRRHFDNLVKRYGKPIIILNLIKTNEKKPRESVLRAEFASAIEYINRDMPEENHLKFLHWDLNNHYKSSNAESVLAVLGKFATYALELTGLFYCQVTSTVELEDGSLKQAFFSQQGECPSESTDTNNSENSQQFEYENEGNNGVTLDDVVKDPMFQKGVLRTNCIDCLDRTNVAQFTYGLAALGTQLHALDVIDDPKVDLDDPLADTLMSLYEEMGDTLALQYGGSAAHNKIFSDMRGQWKPATHSQELIRTFQRYCNNVYLDPEKQDAINVFLGDFQPQPGKPALWELEPDQNSNAGRTAYLLGSQKSRALFKRSLSDGNILSEDSMPSPTAKVVSARKHGHSNSVLPVGNGQGDSGGGLCDCTCGISRRDGDISYSRFVPNVGHRRLFLHAQEEPCVATSASEHGYAEMLCSSNFVDVDWLSSSANSCEEDSCERSSLDDGRSSENIMNISALVNSTHSEHVGSIKGEDCREIEHTFPTKSSEYSDSFVRWVVYGDTLYNCN